MVTSLVVSSTTSALSERAARRLLIDHSARAAVLALHFAAADRQFVGRATAQALQRLGEVMFMDRCLLDLDTADVTAAGADQRIRSGLQRSIGAAPGARVTRRGCRGHRNVGGVHGDEDSAFVRAPVAWRRRPRACYRVVRHGGFDCRAGIRSCGHAMGCLAVPRLAPEVPVTETKLALSAEASAFVRGGGRDVVMQKLQDAVLAAGQHLSLLDEQGDELGIGVYDPENGLVRVYAAAEDGFRRLEAGLLGWRVEQACQLRRSLGLMAPESCYRVIHGAGDGLPGFSCDALGTFGVLWVYAEALWPLARILAETIAGFAKLEGVVVKQRSRTTAADGEVRQEVIGKAPPERYQAKESGVPFEIHPLSGLNAGLFTDMREHRRGLARFTAGKRVLNLFSYTGALSVTCARGGAASVTSVDTSLGVQAWAQGNFRRSELDPTDKRWRFETGDAVRFLARAEKDRERYDLVLIDPPTFSTARGKAWTLDRDYPELIGLAAKTVPPGGMLWLAANTHELGSLARLAHKGLRGVNRVGAVLEQGGLPPDYPTSVAQSRDRYLQVCLLRIS